MTHIGESNRTKKTTKKKKKLFFSRPPKLLTYVIQYSVIPNRLKTILTSKLSRLFDAFDACISMKGYAIVPAEAVQPPLQEL